MRTAATVIDFDQSCTTMTGGRILTKDDDRSPSFPTPLRPASVAGWNPVLLDCVG